MYFQKNAKLFEYVENNGNIFYHCKYFGWIKWNWIEIWKFLYLNPFFPTCQNIFIFRNWIFIIHNTTLWHHYKAGIVTTTRRIKVDYPTLQHQWQLLLILFIGWNGERNHSIKQNIDDNKVLNQRTNIEQHNELSQSETTGIINEVQEDLKRTGNIDCRATSTK